MKITLGQIVRSSVCSVFLITCLFCCQEQVVRNAYPFAHDQKWGLHDERGNIILPPSYDSIAAFKEGVAVFWVKGNCGYIDSTGKVIIDNRYQDCACFNEGVAKVLRRGLGGTDTFIILDKNNRYNFISTADTFSLISKNGLFLVATDKEEDNISYMNKYGKIKIRTNYQHGSFFSDGIAYLWGDYTSAYIDTSGKEILKLNSTGHSGASDMLIKVNDNLYTYFISVDKIDINNPIIKLNNSGKVYHNFVNGYAQVFDLKNKKVGFIDKSGKSITVNFFDEAQDFMGGLAPVRMGSKWGFINSSGEITIAPGFDIILQGFSIDLAQVVLNGNIFWINKKGVRVTPFL